MAEITGLGVQPTYPLSPNDVAQAPTSSPTTTSQPTVDRVEVSAPRVPAIPAAAGVVLPEPQALSTRVASATAAAPMLSTASVTAELREALASGDWQRATALITRVRDAAGNGTLDISQASYKALAAAFDEASRVALQAEPRLGASGFKKLFTRVPDDSGPKQLFEAVAAARDALLYPKIEVSRPYAEYERAGYLLCSGDDTTLYNVLASRLPEGVKLVVFASGDLDAIRTNLAKHLAPERFVVVKVEASKGNAWSRDCLPLPVYAKGADGFEHLALVNARNWQQAEPDEPVARELGLPMLKHSYTFEGGNFCADERGNLFVVDKDNIPDAVFKKFYGCTNVVRLEQRGGIGHVDERIKLVAPDVALTDTPEYAARLEKCGYRVIVLPKGKGLETYVNSTIVNGTVFLPTYGRDTDQQAMRAYESLGLKVVPIDSRDASNNHSGSIHCLTMTYPATVNESTLLSALRGGLAPETPA